MITAIILINAVVQCLYGMLEPREVRMLDNVNIVFVFFWFTEIALRVFAISFSRYWHVNEDFFQMVKNRLDFTFVVTSSLLLAVLIVIRSSNGEEVFRPWQMCTSEDNCTPNDSARILLSLNCLRLFGLMKSVSSHSFQTHVHGSIINFNYNLQCCIRYEKLYFVFTSLFPIILTSLF